MYLDRVLTKAATGSGAGNVTWTTAAQQYALPPASIDATVTYTLLDSGGNAWETGTATLTESGGTYTLTRGGSQTVRASSNSGSAISLTDSSAHTLFLAPDAVALQRQDPPVSAVTVTTSDVTAAVNTHYQLTISGLTADRYLILPSGASAGDVISWELMSDAPADYELILKGDTDVTVTLRNESATAAEVTRYFIEGETGKAVFDGSEWRINRANDGRIASVMSLTLSGNVDGEAANTWTTVDDLGGAWTENVNVGGCRVNGTFVTRRNGRYDTYASMCNKDPSATSDNLFAGVFVDGVACFSSFLFVASSYSTPTARGIKPCNSGSIIEHKFRSYSGGKGARSTADATTQFSVAEIL